MNFPSGDQTGFDETESTRRIGAPPAAGILNTRTPAVSLAATAIHRPSGDHDGAPRMSNVSARGRGFRPSALVHASVERSRRRTAKHTLLPLVALAGARSTEPSF